MKNDVLLLIDFAAWPVIQLTVAKIAFAKTSFDQKHWLYKPREWERDGSFYRDHLKIRSWKRHLPDGAGCSKMRSEKKVSTDGTKRIYKNFILKRTGGNGPIGCKSLAP